MVQAIGRARTPIETICSSAVAHRRRVPTTGSILGSLVAGLLIGLVESLGGLLLDPSYKTLIVFVLYLGVVIVRPNGLFGRF